MNLKQQIYDRYNQLLTDKIDAIRDRITALTDDAKNDAKGSAGDKHETALSMMHIEQERLSGKLREYLKQQEILLRINPLQKHSRVALGSLVLANNLYFFVCCALPKLVFEGKTIFAVSADAPLGKEILGKVVGDLVLVNGVRFEVVEVF